MTSTFSTFMALLRPGGSKQLSDAVSHATPGTTECVVKLQARLAHGTTLPQLVAMAGSRGRQGGAPEEWSWMDPRGNVLVVTLRRGLVERWSASRLEASLPAAHAAPPVVSVAL